MNRANYLDIDRAPCDDYAMTNEMTTTQINIRLAALDADAFSALRTMMIDIDTRDMTFFPDATTLDALRADYPTADIDAIRTDLAALIELARRPYDESARQSLSMIALDQSLCPLHMIDYAICFDDDDPDCAAIRSCFPNHDT